MWQIKKIVAELSKNKCRHLPETGAKAEWWILCVKVSVY